MLNINLCLFVGSGLTAGYFALEIRKRIHFRCNPENNINQYYPSLE